MITCRFCGRELKNPVSIMRGVGPVCAEDNGEGCSQSKIDPSYWNPSQINIFDNPETSSNPQTSPVAKVEELRLPDDFGRSGVLWPLVSMGLAFEALQ